MSAVEIRTPEPVDAEALGRCHLACWREAYGDLVDPARLAPFLADVEGFVSRWRDFLDGAWPVRVAEDANGLVGFASVRPAVDDVPAHLNALYVRRARWSTGLGQRLLDAVLGDEPATLEVFRDNARARRFYARNGFVPDGTEQEEPRLGGVEIGMFRPAQAC
jgi:GNAT superfamily N-acetyltransferase